MKSLQPQPKYRDFSIFQDGSRRHLGFLKVRLLTVTSDELRHFAKFRRNGLNCGRDMVIV